MWDNFEKPQILARDFFETSQRRHGKDIFLKIFSRGFEDVTRKISFFELFLRCFKDVTKKVTFFQMHLRRLKDVTKKLPLLGCF